jgi:hypothetical protein
MIIDMRNHATDFALTDQGRSVHSSASSGRAR